MPKLSVVPMVANKGVGIEELKSVIRNGVPSNYVRKWQMSPSMEEVLARLTETLRTEGLNAPEAFHCALSLLNVGIGLQHVGTRVAQGQPRRQLRTRQRRRHRAVDAHILEALAQRSRLTLADRRKRDVDLALVAAFGVPGRFAVAGKQDAHAW